MPGVHRLREEPVLPAPGSGKVEPVLALRLALILILPPHVPDLELSMDPPCGLTYTGRASEDPPPLKEAGQSRAA